MAVLRQLIESWRAWPSSNAKSSGATRSSGRRSLLGETLEPRRVLASVSGQLFFDRNLDEVRQADEPGIDGVEIRLINRATGQVRTETSTPRDLNQDGIVDQLTETGWYQFSEVDSSDYSLAPRLSPPMQLTGGAAEPFFVPAEEDAVYDVAVDVQPNLLPGDANQDFYLSIDDLVQAIQSGRWQQEGADWASGDWATDAVGVQGAPPVGDGRFDQDDVDALVHQPEYGEDAYNPYWASLPSDQLRRVTTTVDEPSTVLTYDDETGDLVFTSRMPLAALQLRTATIPLRNYATAESPIQLGEADVSNENELGLIRFVAGNRVDLPALLPVGLSIDELARELRVDGARWSGGDLGEIVLVGKQYDGPSGTVIGATFVDANQNGMRDEGEFGTNGLVVEIRSILFQSGDTRDTSSAIDLDGSGEIDPATEVGRIQLSGFPPGDYQLIVTPPPGWVLTTADTIDIQLSGNETHELSFGVIRFANGDTNFDGRIDAADVDTICNGLNAGFFREEFDVNGDGRLNYSDVLWQVRRELGSTLGDANLDGRFDSSDLVQVWAAAEYEDGVEDNSSWTTGDWNCDGDFTAFDLIEALQTGDYNRVEARFSVAQPAGVAETVELQQHGKSVAWTEDQHRAPLDGFCSSPRSLEKSTRHLAQRKQLQQTVWTNLYVGPSVAPTVCHSIDFTRVDGERGSVNLVDDIDFGGDS